VVLFLQECVSTLVRAVVEEEETAALSHLINIPMSTRELMQVNTPTHSYIRTHTTHTFMYTHIDTHTHTYTHIY